MAKKKGRVQLDPYRCTDCEQVMLLDREVVQKEQDDIVCPYCSSEESLSRLRRNDWDLRAVLVLSSDDDDDDDFGPYE